MDCTTHHTDPAGNSLLALVDRQGGDLGATLLRLAHRAAAAHRYEQAARGTHHDMRARFAPDALSDAANVALDGGEGTR